MARTIAEIKKEMTDAFMSEEAVREKYGFTASDTFEGKFSRVSIEGLLFYAAAFGVWALEKLMDAHKEEVSAMLQEERAHTARWYRNLVLGFVPETEEEAPVKYCSVDDRGCRLRVKIAGGSAGAREPLTAGQQAAVEAYLAEEKDAGLKIEVINEQSDQLKATLRVWYDPIRLTPAEKPAEKALKEYISNLDFDGLMSRNSIIEYLRKVPGVEMVRIEQLRTKYANNAWEDFGEQQRAESGYWTAADEDITAAYERYRRENI